MMTISETQSFERWDSLPLVLREALASEENSDFLWKTCGTENIPEDRIYTVAQLAGYVLMGFLHPEDLGEEIKDAINIDAKTAASIQDALNKRIFTPLHTDLNKVYAPISKVGIKASAATSTAPKIIQDIGPSSIASQPYKPAPLPVNKMAPPVTPTNAATTISIAPAPASAKIVASAIPTATAGPNTFAPAAKPVSTSDIGWSKTQSSGPVVKLDMSQMSPGVPKPATQPAAAPIQAPQSQAPARSSSGAMGEFERLGVMKKSPHAGITPTGSPLTGNPSTPTSSTGAPATSAEPAPMMLHEDTSFKADEKNSAFRLSQPEANAEVNLNQTKSQTPPTPRAVVEFGGTPTSSTTTPTSSSAVHYTEFKPSLSSVPTANSGPRNVSQIIPPKPPTPVPSPATASMPVPVPRPPQAAVSSVTQTPQPQQTNKVIVKDFL